VDRERHERLLVEVREFLQLLAALPLLASVK
jgi:hypothetical protein